VVLTDCKPAIGAGHDREIASESGTTPSGTKAGDFGKPGTGWEFYLFFTFSLPRIAPVGRCEEQVRPVGTRPRPLRMRLMAHWARNSPGWRNLSRFGAFCRPACVRAAATRANPPPKPIHATNWCGGESEDVKEQTEPAPQNCQGAEHGSSVARVTDRLGGTGEGGCRFRARSGKDGSFSCTRRGGKKVDGGWAIGIWRARREEA
jgi:hypothetical protein